jgi:hypothetical protein
MSIRWWFCETSRAADDRQASQLQRRLLICLRRDRFDRELEEEMRVHLEMKAEKNLAGGTSLDEACYAPQRQFGAKV